MGYSTVEIDKFQALMQVKQLNFKKKIEVYAASDASFFTAWPLTNEILRAEESDHGHYIFNLTRGRFVDYKIKK